MDVDWAESGGSGSGRGEPQTAIDAANESKRLKRKREMADRVERHRRDTIDRKDEIYRDLHNSYGLSLAAISAQPCPNHPEYLLRLHAASLQRDADLLQTRLENEYALETARQLYASEVDRIEDEYEAAKKAIRDKLLEACDERVKKLREEKDNAELTGLLQDGPGGSLYGGDGHSKHHATRRTRPINGTGSGAVTAAGAAAGSSGGVSNGANGNTGVCSLLRSFGSRVARHTRSQWLRFVDHLTSQASRYPAWLYLRTTLPLLVSAPRQGWQLPRRPLASSI